MQVSIRLFGNFQISFDGRTISLGESRASSLLAYLALRPNIPVSRETLIEALWPEAISPDLRRLRQAVWKLRKLITPVGSGLTIETTLVGALVLHCDPLAIDAIRFNHFVTAKDDSEASLRAAVDLYKGDLLTGWTDEWINRPRLEFQVRFLEAVKQMAATLMSNGAAAEALTFAREAVNADPADEDANYIFMRAADACRKPAAALAQYDIHLRALEDLDSLPPAVHLEALANELRLRGRASRSRSSITAASAIQIESLPLVERRDEHARLLHLLDRGIGGGNGALFITGPAGIGKTRLIAAAVAEARLRGFTIYKGECPDVPNPPLWLPVVEALHEPLKAAISDGQSPILAVLQPDRRDTRQRNRRIRQFGPGVLPIHSSLVAEELFGLLQLRAQRPALFVVENIERADEATIVWLDLLLRRIREFQVCTILTARTGDQDQHALRIAHIVEASSDIVRLHPLTRAGARRLIATALRVEDPPQLLCDAMWHHIGGNPLSILRAITVLQTQEILRPSAHGWMVKADVPDALAVFASSHIKRMVQQQLRTLPESTREVLAAAAIIGGDVLIDHLQRLTGLGRQRFLAELDILFRQGLLVSRARGLLRFTHEEVRHAVLDDTTPPRRHALHGQVAVLLSSLGDAARPEYLFWHSEAAGDFERAAEAATAAGDHCYALGEHPAAITWYERALEAFSHEIRAGDVGRRLDTELKLEAALNQHGDRQRQIDVLGRVLREAGAAGYHNQLCEASIRCSLCLTRMNRRTDAIQAAERGLVIARRWSDGYRQARAHRALGLAYDVSDDLATVRHLTSAVRLFRRLKASADESITLSELAITYDRLGQQTNALRSLNRAVTLLPQTDPARAALRGRQGSLLLWQGRLTEALGVLQEALMVSEKVGHRVDQARTLRVLHDAYCLAGRYREALAAAGQAWRIATQARDARLLLMILNSLLGAVYARLGLIGRARNAFARMEHLLADDPESWYQPMAESSLADAYAESGQWSDARRWAERAIATANAPNRHGGSSILAGAQQTLGQALLELGSPDLAIEPLLKARAHFRAVGELIREAHITALLGIAASDYGDRVGASSYLHESIRLMHQIDRELDLRHIHYLHGRLWERLEAPTKAMRAYRTAHSRLLQIAAGIAPRAIGDRMPSLRRHFLNLPLNKRIIEAATRGMRQVPQVMPAILALRPWGPNGNGSRANRIAARRKAILRAFGSSAKRVTRHDLAVALGVTPRTITNDLAALRRAGHQVHIADSE